MKTQFVCILSIILLALCLNACSSNLEKFVEPKTVLVDFTFRVSTNYAGLVRFINMSKGAVKYEWNFGSVDANGEPGVSFTHSPFFTYPRNGTYNVLLTITDEQNYHHSINKKVVITNQQN